jgi:hypothetical protein
MDKMKSKLATILPLLMMAENMGNMGSNSKNYLRPEDIDTTPKEKPIPKGCKRYFYNKTGLCCKGESEVYFDALKPSKAHDKFQRWLNSFPKI